MREGCHLLKKTLWVWGTVGGCDKLEKKNPSLLLPSYTANLWQRPTGRERISTFSTLEEELQ